MARNITKPVGWGVGGGSVETGKILKKNKSLYIGIEWRNAVLRAFMYMFAEPNGLGECTIGYKKQEWCEMKLNGLARKT